MTSLLLAFSFLTRYPVPAVGRELDARDLGRATGFFPLAGLALGLDLLFFRWLFELTGGLERWPLAGAALLLAYAAWAGDSLHLDGLADTGDGLASRQRGAALLDVMHDSRNGSFGVLAIVLVLLMKFAYFASLPAHYWWALPLPLLFSRLLAALLCQSRPYAGHAGSLSAWFIEGSRGSDAFNALGWSFGGFAALSTAAVLTGQADARACGLALGACVVGMVLGWLLVQVPRERLGGISGDLIGYALEACEIGISFLLLFLLT